MLVIIFLGSLVSGLVFAYLFKILKILDKPDNIRKIHKNPTPPVGGLVLLLLFLYLMIFHNSALFGYIFVIPALCLFILGIFDDIFDLNVLIKLIAQILATSFIAYKTSQSLMDIIFFTLFFSVYINSVNFIDNSSGVCVSFLVFAFAFLYFITFNIIFIYFCIACVALLLLNLPGEKIFLGNNGSFFISYIILISLNTLQHGTKPNNTLIFFIDNFFFLFIPLLDFAFVVVRRFLEGYPIYKPDNRHISFVLENICKSKELALIVWNIFLFVVFLINIVLVKNNIPYIYNNSK